MHCHYNLNRQDESMRKIPCSRDNNKSDSLNSSPISQYVFYLRSSQISNWISSHVLLDCSDSFKYV